MCKQRTLVFLPVVFWEDDKRGQKKLIQQAKRGKTSRAKFYKAFFEQNQNSEASTGTTSRCTVGDISSNITTSANSTLTYALKDDNLHSNSKLNDYTISNPKVDVLLIGMSYNRDIVKQYEGDDRVGHISDCIDSQTGKKFDPAVARDTYRCYVMSKMYQQIVIYTVNTCD